MAYGARTNHVEIDVDQTPMQMLVGFDGRRVITILPERPMPIFPLVIFLRRSSGDELDTLRHNICRRCASLAGGRDWMSSYSQARTAVARLCFKELVQITTRSRANVT
jgi:hypothetical protein